MNGNNKLIYIIVIIILVLLGVGGYFLSAREAKEKNENISNEQNEENDFVNEENENYTNQQKNEEQNNNENSQTQTQTKEITVMGSEFKFEPNIITVNKGEKVKITFKNIGNAPHNLVIPELSIETKTIRKGETDTIEFTASVSKTYEFICSIPGHKEKGMEGDLDVK